MGDVLKVEIEVICMVHLLAIILSIASFMIFYMRARKDAALNAFLVVQISMIGWMVFKIFKTVSPNINLRWWFIVAYYACTIVLEVAFLEFGYAYNKGHGLSKRVRRIIYILPVFQLLVVVTNPLHYKLYATYNFWTDTFGPLFYVHTFIEYIYIAVGFYYCAQTFKVRFQNEKKWYKWLISLAILFPLIFNFLYITKVIDKIIFSIGIRVVFDITPLVFIWSLMIFVYATFKYDFISRTPIMQHEIIHRLDTAVSVHQLDGKTIYMNEKLQYLLGTETATLLDNLFSKSYLYELADSKRELKIDNKYCIVYVKTVTTLGRTEYIVTYKDITAYRLIEEEIKSNQLTLDASNRALEEAIELIKKESKIGARTFVARELHDIIGHSLVVTIKLLEVTKLYYKRDRQMSLLAVSDASESIAEGIREMTIISEQTHQRRHYNGNQLEKELEKILKQFKLAKIKTSLRFKGGHYTLNTHVYETLRKVATELITNALKHSNGSQMLVFVSITESLISMKVVDNGFGREHFLPGNGLKGIEERLSLIDGQVHYSTSLGEGFMANVKVNR